MENKMIGFLVIAVAVGLAAGAGIGYLVFDEEPVEQQKYWFYLDYGDYEDADKVNRWVSVEATSAGEAIKKVPGTVCSDNETYGVSLDSIDGLATKEVSGDYVCWQSYIYNGTYLGSTAFDKSWSASNFGFGNAYSTCWYLAYHSYGEAVDDAGWIGEGPLAE